MVSNNMWMLRAGEGGYLLDEFKQKSAIAIGWKSIGSLSKKLSREDIKALLREKADSLNLHQINTAAGQIYRFINEMCIDDFVLTYDSQRRIYLVGKVTSEYAFMSSEDFPHKRSVDWFSEISRDSLSVSTKNSLGAISTLFEIKDDSKSEILSLLSGGSQVVEYDQKADEEELKEDIALRAYQLIQDKILQLDWEEMQELVAGILRAMGYKTLVTEKGADRGKDIEASPDGLLLEEPRVLVEVKHRKGQMGATDIRNFHSTLRGKKGLYVSTGGFSKEAKYEAERGVEHITLIDVNRLTDLLIDNYDACDVDTKLLVPLTKIYWPN